MDMADYETTLDMIGKKARETYPSAVEIKTFGLGLRPDSTDFAMVFIYGPPPGRKGRRQIRVMSTREAKFQIVGIVDFWPDGSYDVVLGEDPEV